MLVVETTQRRMSARSAAILQVAVQTNLPIVLKAGLFDLASNGSYREAILLRDRHKSISVSSNLVP